MAGMTFTDRLENWLARIPGISTYRDYERRRETDKRLREHLASRLNDTREDLQRIALELSRGGRLEPLDELGRLSSRIQQVVDMIRYASYGYAGIFDHQVRIREEELEQLYTFDLSLMDEVDSIASEIQTLAAEAAGNGLSEGISHAHKRLDALKATFHKRRDFMTRPTE